MKKIIIACLLFLSINGIAQDMDVVKYGYFSNPIFPIMTYQNLAVNKIPKEIEEVTYVYNNTNKAWEKREEISYFLNSEGFIDYLTKKTYYVNTVTDSYKRNYSYSSSGPTKILVTRDKQYMSSGGGGDMINDLEYVFNNGGLESIIADKDTIDTRSGEMMGKDHQIESEDFNSSYNLVYTNKIFGMTMHKHHSYSSSDDTRALFHFEEKLKTIDIYLPTDRTFYFSKLSEYRDSDIESLRNARSVSMEAYQKLLLEPNYFNNNKVQGVGHLTFKDGVNGNWIAIFNVKNTSYLSPTITMRKITFPDNSIEGTLVLDESLSSKVK